MGPNDSAILAILRRSDNKPAGVGFRVDDGLIITCAHVVEAALGHRSGDLIDPPEEKVTVRFSFLESQDECSASVVDWVPVYRGEIQNRPDSEDIAVLRLDQSNRPPTNPIRLEAVIDGADVRSYGFPPQAQDQDSTKGRPEEGKLMGRETSRLWIIAGANNEEMLFEPGFSGSPVWDMSHKKYVGMMVLADQPEAAFPTTPRAQLRGRRLRGYMIAASVLNARIVVARSTLGAASPGRPKIDPGELVYDLPNRTDIYKDLRENAFRTLARDKDKRRPIICPFYLRDMDDHQGFIDVVAQIKLKEALQEARLPFNVMESHPIRWPTRGNLDARFRKLMSELDEAAKPIVRSNSQDRNESPTAIEQSMVLFSTIEANACDKRDLSLVDQLINDWKVGLKSQYALFYFIAFRTQSRRGFLRNFRFQWSSTERMFGNYFTEFDGKASEWNRASFVKVFVQPLSQFRPVELTEAESWVRKHGNPIVRQDKRRKLMQEVQELYNDGELVDDTGIRSKPLSIRLREIVDGLNSS